MRLSEIKTLLNTVDTIHFKLENGNFVPDHFHVTEIGVISKRFIDCGGTVRHETIANFQLWNANDWEHQLKPSKLLKIIALSEKNLAMEDLNIEVEYQTETVGKYDVSFDGKNFILHAKVTACLAQENCSTGQEKSNQDTCCATESNCC